MTLLKATKHAERVQINKSHWLNNVSRAHFIGRERFPKHHFLVFLTHLQFFHFKIILTEKFSHFESDNIIFSRKYCKLY